MFIVCNGKRLKTRKLVKHITFVTEFFEYLFRFSVVSILKV